MTIHFSPWLRRRRPALRRTLIILLAAYALYLLAANVFLNTALGEHAVNRKPQRYHAQWSWAMSLYPGHIYARDLRMGGHARTTLWAASSPAAHGRIQLLPLLRRTLSFGTVRARDVTIGFDQTIHDLPSPPRLKSPWHVHLDAITTRTVRGIRYGKLVVDGGGEASFAMDKELRGGPIEILPSRLVMPNARVRYGDMPLIEGAHLDFDLAMSPHIRAQASGSGKLKVTRARLRINGAAPSLDLRQHGSGTLTLKRGREAGRISADITLDHGALVRGGRVRWSTPLLVDGAQGGQRYRAQIALDVLADAVGLRVQVPRLANSANHVDADLRIGSRRVPPLQWRALLRELSGSIALQWHFDSLRWLEPLLSEAGWLRFTGDADVLAGLRLEQGELQPGSHVEVPHASVQADVFDNVFSGDARARARVQQARTVVDLVVDRFELSPHGANDQPYVRGNDLRLGLVASRDLARFRDTVKAHLQFEDAKIPDLRAYNRNLPGDSLRFLGGTGTLGGDLRLDAAGEVGSGRLRLRGDRASIRLGVSTLIGNLKIDTHLNRAQKTGRHYTLDGFELGLDDVRVLGAEDAAGPWWARLGLDHGTLDWQRPFKVGGDVRLDMKDASVLLSLFAERSAFPKWIGNLVDEGEARATGTLRVDGETVVLDRIHASNDRVDLDARLRIARGQPSGDLYARWGVFGVGVELQGGQRKLHLAGARKWYDAQPSLLPEQAAR